MPLVYRMLPACNTTPPHGEEDAWTTHTHNLDRLGLGSFLWEGTFRDTAEHLAHNFDLLFVFDGDCFVRFDWIPMDAYGARVGIN